MNTFGSILYQLRTDAGYKQSELSELFSLHNNPVSSQAISKWEKDNSLPNAVQFLTLCEIYGAYHVLSSFLPEDTSYPVSSLNYEGYQKVLDYISLLQSSGRYHKPHVKLQKKETTKTFRLYDLPVSAGTGELLLGDTYEECTFSEDVPDDADYCLRISGDSMEPHFHNGQIVFVHIQNVLSDGDIGIFGYDGRAYCKKLSLTTAGTKLVSLNHAYEPIEIPVGAELLVFGKVVEV